MILPVLLVLVSCVFSSLFSVYFKIAINKKSWIYLTIALLFSLIGLLIYLLGLASLPMGIARIFSSLNFVLVPMFSYFMLKEPMNRELIVGVILILLGEIVMFL